MIVNAKLRRGRLLSGVERLVHNQPFTIDQEHRQMIDESYGRVVEFDLGGRDIPVGPHRNDASRALRFIVGRPSGQLGEVLVERPHRVPAVPDELQPRALVKRAAHD